MVLRILTGSKVACDLCNERGDVVEFEDNTSGVQMWICETCVKSLSRLFKMQRRKEKRK